MANGAVTETLSDLGAYHVATAGGISPIRGFVPLVDNCENTIPRAIMAAATGTLSADFVFGSLKRTREESAMEEGWLQVFNKENVKFKIYVTFFGLSCVIFTLFATLLTLSIIGLAGFSIMKMLMGVIGSAIFLIVNAIDTYGAGGLEC